jgi:maleylacetate reductase
MSGGSSATEVVFGAGSFLELPSRLDELGVKRVLVISTARRAGLADSIRVMLGSRVVDVFDRAAPHVPEDVAGAALEAARASAADCFVAPGGGSAIGVAKAVSMETGIPIVAIPTTYSGSEMTPIWGLTRNGVKVTGRDQRIQPRLVIYDPDLTLGLSVPTTVCSGLNAIAHCVEALYALDEDVTRRAVSGIGLLSQSLPRLAADPRDASAREAALKGAWHAGVSLSTAPMALHHKLCHTLGGSFDLPHAETHAVLLPYTTAFNREAAPEAMISASEALGGGDAPRRLLDLAVATGAPLSLRELGFSEDDVEPAARLASEREYPNPRPVTEHGIEDLLTAALDGDNSYVQPRDI